MTSKTKKVVVIGRGTVGATAVGVLLNKFKYDEVVWAYNPDIPTTSVGEGSNLVLPNALGVDGCKLSWNDMIKTQTVTKVGIYKRNWPGTDEFIHDFPANNTGLHFNALELQDYLYKKFTTEYSDRVKILEGNFVPEEFDCDRIVACTGNPTDYSNYVERTGIPVNACYVQQFPWKGAKFDYTLTIAMKHGWVFGIPLRNRVALGYLYNSSISTLEEIKEDVQSLVDEFADGPASQERVLNFRNYTRNVTFDGRTVYTGNAGFFLEPLEATSTGTAIIAVRKAAMYWDEENSFFKQQRKAMVENYIQNELTATEGMIALHYLGKSKFDTPFWKFANERAYTALKNIISTTPHFKKRIEDSLMNINKGNFNMPYSSPDDDAQTDSINRDVGTWPLRSYVFNIHQLEIKDILENILDEIGE